MHALADRDWVGAPQLLAALILAGGAAVLLFGSFGEGPADGGTTPAPSRASAPAPPPIPVRHEPAGVRFEVAGASFQAIARPAGAWAGGVARLTPRPGERLLAVAVEIVNRGRRGFNPGLLSYLARGAGGVLSAPLRAGVVGPNGLGLASGLPVGARAEERLVFSLPAALRKPVLAIQPSPQRALEVRIPLDG